MNSEPPSRRPSPAGTNTDSVRRQVVDVAAELMRGTSAAGTGFASDASDQSAMNLYLALLTDRLPVYARTMMHLATQVGEASVEENLIPVAHATIHFYCEILASKVSVFTKPDQLVQLRRVLKSHNLGPQAAYGTISAYLDEERELGRIPADIDCEACAHLLIGACVNYAFTKMLLDEVAPPDTYVERAVRGLRLST